MGQVIAAILLIVAIAVAFKIAIILLVLAGLIFRTKETIVLLAIGGLITLLSRHPMIGLAVIGAGIIAALTLRTRSRNSEDPPPSLPEQSEE